MSYFAHMDSFASKADCSVCALKSRCSPNTSMRRVPRGIYEGARDIARNIAKTDAYAIATEADMRSEGVAPNGGSGNVLVSPICS
jgi:hypothetical protein